MLIRQDRRIPITNLKCWLLITTFVQALVFEWCVGMEFTDKVNLLHQEALNGNDSAVRILLEDVEADARLTEGGLTAFYRAASGGHRKTMHVLMLAGAEINAEVTDPAMDLDGAPYDLLRYAIRLGDVTAVENLLSVGANTSSISAKWRYTPLHDAVEKRRYNITRILLERKVNVNADSVNGPALSIAARQGNMDMVLLLHQYGADIDGAGTDKPPLLEAVAARNQDVALKLVELGANLSATSKSGDKAIHIAVKNNLNKVTINLIKKGLVNQVNKDGRTPLHLVQRAETANTLLTGGALVNSVTYKGETPLHYAAYSGNYGLAELLVKNGARLDLLSNETYGMIEPFEDQKQLIRVLFRNYPKNKGNNTNGFSPLAIAIWMNNTRIVTLLIGNKSPLNADGLIWPPLHMAAYCGDVMAIQELVNAGALVDVRDFIGWTPLHKAALKGSVAAVECMVRLGAELDAEDQNGRTPLHLAAEYGRLEIAKFLISSGANTNLKDSAGFNALAWAVAGSHPYFLRLMMDKFSDMDSTNRYEYLITLAKQDIDAIINITLNYKQFMYRFDEGALRDFLNKAIQDIHIDITDIAKRLKEYASDKDRPLTFDIIRKIIEYSLKKDRKLQLEMTALIANQTSNLNSQDSILGYSVLHWAAAAGDLEVVKLLVQKGTFVNAESKLGQTPMFLARRWGHKDLYRYFKESGAIW